MCQHLPRHWFLAKSKGHGRILHIISARSYGSARASMGRLSEEYNFTELTWSDLNRLAGIAPPTVNQETTLAEGPLMYEHNGRVVSIEVAT